MYLWKTHSFNIIFFRFEEMIFIIDTLENNKAIYNASRTFL